jgi:hypothetical protein
MAFGRKREPAGSPEVEAARQAIGTGWNGLPWGTKLAGFQARFPGAMASLTHLKLAALRLASRSPRISFFPGRDGGI